MDDVDEVADAVGEVLADHPVAFGYLFGSVARGTSRPTSDVDVAVRFEDGLSPRGRFDRLLAVGVDLERRLGRRVDVVDLESAPLRLAGRILVGRRIVTGLDRPERVRYETALFPRYVDEEHHAARLDAQVLAVTAAGER